MSDLPPEEVVRNRALPLPPATTCSCIKTRPPLAHSVALQDVPGTDIRMSPAWTAPPQTPPVSIARWTARMPKFTTRCASLFFDYKCASFHAVCTQSIFDDHIRRFHAEVPTEKHPESADHNDHCRSAPSYRYRISSR